MVRRFWFKQRCIYEHGYHSGQRNVKVCAPDIPTTGITFGDSVGIGVEVWNKAFQSILLDAAAWSRAASDEGGGGGKGTVAAGSNGLLLLPLVFRDVGIKRACLPTFKFGTISGECGRASIASIEMTVLDAQAGMVDAVMTAPLNEAAMHNSGCFGHRTPRNAWLHGCPRCTLPSPISSVF